MPSLRSFGWFRSRKVSAQRRKAPAASFKPGVEALEDRLAPATLTPNQSFVDRVFRDLLNRPPDPATLAVGGGFLDSGGSRAQLVQIVEHSVEYRVDEAIALFDQVLGHGPDTQELIASGSFLFNGGSYFVLGALLAGSPEYYLSHGGTVDGYVDGVFSTFFKHPADATDHFVVDEALTGGLVNRFQLALDLFESGEGQAILMNNLAEQFLRRPISSGEVGLWSSVALTAGIDTLIADLLATPEYFQIANIHATHLVTVAQPAGSTPAGADFGTIVEALDDSGQLDLTFSGDVAAAIGTNPAGGTLSGTTTETAFQGVATFLDLSLDKVGTGYTLTTSAAGLASTTSSGFNITPAPANHVVFTGQPPSTVVAGAGFGVTVTALDQFNNVDTSFDGNVSLGLATSPSGGALGGTTTVAASGGTATFSGLFLNKTGTYTLDAGSGSLGGDTSTATTVTPAAATQLVVSGTPASVTAGSSFTFTVTAQDQFGNTATGYGGTVHFTSSDGQVRADSGLPVNYTFVAGDAGVHTFTNGATLKTAGSQTITAADTTTSSITGTSSAISVNPAAASKFVVSAPATVTGFTPFTFTVTAEDAFNNTATGYTGTAQFTSSDGKAVLPSNYTFVAGDNGVHTFTNGATLKTSGSQTITATDTVTASITGTSNAITVSSVHLNITATSPQSAGVPFTFTVTAVDQSNNTVTTYNGTVHFTSTDGQAMLPMNYTFVAGDNGVHTFTNGATLKTAGSQTITATDSVNGVQGTSASITVTPAPATHLSVLATSPQTSGSAFNFTVTALDQFNNTATGYRGTVHFTKSDSAGGSSVPANYTFAAGDNGVHTFSATLVTAGNQTITATDTTTSSITGTSNAIRVKETPSVTLSITGTASQAISGTFTFKVTVNGNGPTPTGSIQVSFALASPIVDSTGSQTPTLTANLPANTNFASVNITGGFTAGTLTPGFNYTVSASYVPGGDPNYNSANAGNTLTGTWGPGDDDGDVVGHEDDDTDDNMSFA